MSKTLLEQARELPRPEHGFRNNYTEDHLDLLVAFCRREITGPSIEKVLGLAKGSAYGVMGGVALWALRTERLIKAKTGKV